MNEPTPYTASPPPQIPPTHAVKPLGEDAVESEPIPNAIAATEAILRQPRRLMFQLRQPGSGKLILAMLFVALVCSGIYGLVVGSFSGGSQWWAAPAKIAGGLLASTLICLPSLYIFACLSGSQARLTEIFGLVVGLLMLMTILLVGFAPVAWIFSESTGSATWMGTLHLIFWFIATAFGLKFLNNGFAHSNARSSAGVNVWIIIFVIVMLQMTTALRPIVGTSETFLPVEKKFFLKHWFDSMDMNR
jgi:hypothetical protein